MKMNQKQVNHMVKMVRNHSGFYRTRNYLYYMVYNKLVRLRRAHVGDNTYYGTEQEIMGEYREEA